MPCWISRTLALGSGALAMHLSTPVARAELPGDSERAAARSMATRAMDLMREQRFEEAQRLLDQSYDIVPAPTIGVLEGDALLRLGRLRDAEQTFREVARARVNGHSPVAFRKAVQLARRRLEELDQRIPRLTVVVTNAHVQRDELRIDLNGEAQSPALLGIERRVDPGKYTLAVHEPNGGTHRHDFELREGQRERVAVDLAPGRSAPVRVAEGATGSETWFTRRNVGWVTLGVGAAGLTTGVIAGIVMSDKNGDLDEACDPGCPPRVASDIDAFETARTVSLVGLGAGAIATTVGAALVLTDDAGKERARVAPYVAAETLGVEGRF